MSTSRMRHYVPLAREFSARVLLFHEAVGDSVGLNATDVKVLRLLGDASMTAGQLAEHIGLTGAAVTAVVDRLEAAGYATRERDEADRRRVTIRAVPAKTRRIDRLYDAYGARWPGSCRIRRTGVRAHRGLPDEDDEAADGADRGAAQAGEAGVS